MDESIARVGCSTVSDNDPNDLQPHLSNIQFGENLTAEQKETAQNLINQYTDVFAVNPKKPQITNLIEHRIITPDALPVNNKARRFPKAWEPEIDQQIQEMLENEVIRPSSSPWNAPIILVKKKITQHVLFVTFAALTMSQKRILTLCHI